MIATPRRMITSNQIKANSHQTPAVRIRWRRALVTTILSETNPHFGLESSTDKNGFVPPTADPCLRSRLELASKTIPHDLPHEFTIRLVEAGLVPPTSFIPPRKSIMKRLLLLSTLAACCVFGLIGNSRVQLPETGKTMSSAAIDFLDELSDEEKETVHYKYDAPERLGWHFIPKNDRKGLQVKVMNGAQREAAFHLLQQSLSESGYTKARQIMSLEGLLAELEKGQQGGNIRDPERYYFTLFGDVSHDGRWGLSVEGHHLSLNFVVSDDQVVSSTPTFFATNPAEVKSAVGDYAKGLRVLKEEETLAFELVNSLNEQQREVAVFAEKAPADIRAAGKPHAPQGEPIGLPGSDLTEEQLEVLTKLIETYTSQVPADIAAKRWEEIKKSGGVESLKFAWAGAMKPGVGHYYRVEGDTMLIEFANTQPDSAGNPANHIHCVWRDPRGDFGLKAE